MRWKKSWCKTKRSCLANEPLNLADRDDAIAVLRRLHEAGHVAYFAGGCVRDLLLGIPPQDYDVATDAPPPRIRDLFPRSQAVGAAFGVVLVLQGRSKIEVATFRTDGPYLDGRRPAEVRFTTAEDDARRRDFTINGLFYNPLDETVLDFIGGQADLHAGLIRAIGDPARRFAEDHLRLLRAVRFAARLRFALEPSTAKAIALNAPHLMRIAPERVGQEMRLMLQPPTRAMAWRLLHELQLTGVLFRFLKNIAAPVALPGILARLSPSEPIPLGLALAAASMDWTLGGPISATLPDAMSLPTAAPSGDRVAACLARRPIQNIVQALRQSLKISNEESDELAGTLQGVGTLLNTKLPGTATLKRFLALATGDLSRQLLWALHLHVDLSHATAIEARLIELESTEFAPRPLLSGDQLTAAGFAPGPLFKRLLNTVYDAQLEDRIHSFDEALSMAKTLALTENHSGEPLPKS